MMRLSAVTETVLSTCALIGLGLLIGRGLNPPVAAVGEAGLVLGDEDRAAILDGARRLGSDRAERPIVVFSDFQCPYCAQLADAFREAQRRTGDRLSLVFRHFPLESIHPHAAAAAAAAECAGDQARFGAYHDALFSVQSRIGALPWDSIAALAGVPDRAAFRACVSGNRHAARVAADRQLGERLGIEGTPTVFLDGRRVAGPFTPERLIQLLEGS